MHPQIIRDKPGSCPICGMTLVPLVTSDATENHQHPTSAFFLLPERRQAIGLTTTEVQEKPLAQEVRLPGRVAFDADLYITENEYVTGLQSGNEAEVMQAIEKKLRRLGLSDEEFSQLKKMRKADASLFLPRPSGPIWVYASVYESDLPAVTKGMRAEIGPPNNKSFLLEGEVKSVEPILDATTRTATARIFVPNIPQAIRPDTYVDVVLKKDLGEHLAIPFDAVIDTGTRQIVFVDLGDGYLEPREVTLGMKAGDDYPVVSGLVVGEKVVTSAHFLLDSESQIQAAIKKFGEVKGGHPH